ncbi:hypothetical protein [Mycobacterium paraterrae]|uniref:PE-PGRS family protein n=1 Tax=Mycobacterium paraterrae TaxID=577492 RepID=A0ABY3VUX2_9MYCO|nr:hypothetical protein [Mycobacterium paraterrae]UMB71305.1 hypothetical protein MKK62_08690 [Mycobacterium paraterrae]
MHIRKIAAAAGFACGAALAFAPLAQADPSSFAVTTLDNEINSQNSILETYALLTGDSADITTHGSGVYDTINQSVTPYLVPGDATYGQVTPLETEIYGANPILAGISTDTGPYNVFNGALTEYYDAYNVLAFAAQNGGALDTNPDDYLGSPTSIAAGLDTGSVSGAYQYFLNFALGDLKGYDAIFAPPANTPGDIDPYISNEIVQLNNLFELDGKLAGVYGDIIPNVNSIPGNYVGFDTIDPDNTNTLFNELVFGLNPANVSDDPGSYDVLNGALSEFFNASNVGLYSLLNGGDILPVADVIGTHADFLSGGVSSAITDFLNLGFQDLLGYFEPGALMP